MASKINGGCKGKRVFSKTISTYSSRFEYSVLLVLDKFNF